MPIGHVVCFADLVNMGLLMQLFLLFDKLKVGHFAIRMGYMLVVLPYTSDICQK